MTTLRKRQTSHLKFMSKNSFVNTLVLVVACVMLTGIVSCFAQDELIYDAKGRRNPFIPLVTSDGRILKLDNIGEDQKGLSLDGIAFDKNGISYALVNGEIVNIGDTVNGYTVLKIETERVTFIKDGELLQLELNKEG